jgi:hypothetical protein
MFRVLLGMVRPRRVDDVWAAGHLCHCPTLARLLSRDSYYAIHTYANVDICDLLAACNGRWSSQWEWGGAAAGDETIVPHKGKKAGHMRQFIPRKPHSTGLKLYVLADAAQNYVSDVYFYTGRRGNLRKNSPHAGSLTAAGIVHRWVDLLPPTVVLVCDSFFGSHATARALVDRQHPFLLLTKRDEYGVQEAGVATPPGSTSHAVFKDGGYELFVYKNPRVGHKPPRVVPLLSNCVFPEGGTVHARGYTLPAVVQVYRQLAGGVDTSNQMALQHRELGRFVNWAKAVRAFLLRYAVVNCHTVARLSGVAPADIPLWDFQFRMVEAFFPTIPIGPGNPVHCPEPSPVRTRCAACGTVARTRCCSCGVQLHARMHADHHPHPRALGVR